MYMHMHIHCVNGSESRRGLKQWRTQGEAKEDSLDSDAQVVADHFSPDKAPDKVPWSIFVLARPAYVL